MKFGKDLQQYRVVGWEDCYIDYKGLKIILNGLKSDGASRDEIDSQFFDALEESLEHVNRFFLEKCGELESALDKCTQGRPNAAGSDAQGQDSVDSTRLAAEAPDSSQQDFYEAYRDLGRLQTFVWINTKGFQKIMKKYDKRNQLRGSGRELGPEFEKRLEKESFCSGKIEVLAELFKSRRPDAVQGLSSSSSTARPRLQLVTGNANRELADEISARLGVPLTPAKIGKFADGEVSIQILENVRNSDVYIIQPTCTPVNDNLMELLLMSSALRRSAAQRVTAVVPYYGYARQDRKERSRVPISAADVAKMMEAMGIDRVCCVDLHCGQIQGFFGPRTPVDNLWATPIAISYFITRKLQNIAVVSPDAGGVARAKMFREGLEANGLRASLAMIIKQRVTTRARHDGGPNEVGETDLVGSVVGCDCIVVDDMIDTAVTLVAAANELVAFGACRVFAFATHGLFNGPAVADIEASPIEEVVVTNTIPLPANVNAGTRKVRQVSVGKLLAQAIKCIHTGDSVKSLFEWSQGASLLA